MNCLKAYLISSQISLSMSIPIHNNNNMSIIIIYITIPYLESESRRFINKLAKIIKNKINVNIVPVYKSFKIGRYFQLKSDTPLALCSNVVYKFTCSCDMNLTYYGMSTRHLITRVREHLDFNSIQRSAIKDHILSCDVFGCLTWYKVVYCYQKMSIKVSYQNTRSFIN